MPALASVGNTPPQQMSGDPFLTQRHNGWWPSQDPQAHLDYGRIPDITGWQAGGAVIPSDSSQEIPVVSGVCMRRQLPRLAH